MSIEKEFQSALERAIAETVDSEVEITELYLLPGGASQQMWHLDLTIAGGDWAGTHALVVRRPLGGKIIATALDLEIEYSVLRAAYDAGVPAPRPYWYINNVGGEPIIIMERLGGETIGRRIVKEPALSDARARLPAQMGEALASIHAIDLDERGLRDVLPGPDDDATPALTQIRRFEAALDRIDEPHPALELGIRWLRLHEPAPPERLTLVHGDFRIGNMVVDDTGLAGILDWEFAHIGDPAEDLGWPLVRDWRFGRDTLRFGGISQPAPFFDAYGQPVDEERVFYWEVLGNVGWAIGTLNQAQRYLRGEESNLEFASLGRRCAEMELEALRLIRSTEA